MATDSSTDIQEAPHNVTRAQTRIDDSLLQCLSWICGHYGMRKSDDSLMVGLPRERRLTPSLALTALENAGFKGGLIEREALDLPLQVLPMIVLRKNHGACILLGRESRRDEQKKIGWYYQLIMPEVSPQPVEVSHQEFDTLYCGYAILVKPQARLESQVEQDIRPAGHWLFSTLWRYHRYYRSAAIATVVVNLLALATIFFTMNVYDRVIPNQAFVTLWSLAIGVAVAMIFEAITRYVRAYLIDVAGKKTDLIVGNLLFSQALAVKMEHKPTSSGSFANQVREFEMVRDFVSSASLAAISDLPFALLFMVVIFSIGGPLGWIPLFMIPLILLVSIVIQWPLRRILKNQHYESSLKQGVLIESVEGMETLKAVAGESYMLRRWQKFSAMQATSAMKSKHYASLATGFTMFFQQFQTVMLVVMGVYLITAGDLSMGALIATVMLAGRCTAPLSQVVGLAVRWQQARAALESLNRLMDMPTDRPKGSDYLPDPEISGALSMVELGFSYPAPPGKPAPEVLKDISLTIKPGERVAIIGRIGSGKSTLLRILARLYTPVKGQLFADGLEVNQIDPADWRRAVGYVGQEARLFYGTLRENIMIGMPDATSREFMRVLQLTGLDRIAANHPSGINLPVGENGSGLSGGQRQLVSLARTLLTRPKIILLDEPTSAMDTQTEKQFIDRLRNAIGSETLILVTHRPSLLALVDRLIVVEEGKIVADGPREAVLMSLNGQQPAVQGAVVKETKVPGRPSARKVETQAVLGQSQVKQAVEGVQ